MDVNLVNPFIEAALNVLGTMASTKANAGKPFLKEKNAARGDVTGIVGMTGETEGTISISFTEKCILSIVSNMFGEEMKEMNDEIGDAVGEIANMVSGQARKQLSEQGRSLKAAIPTVIMGKNHSLTHITNKPIIAIPFTSDNGNFTIEVCM